MSLLFRLPGSVDDWEGDGMVGDALAAIACGTISIESKTHLSFRRGMPLAKASITRDETTEVTDEGSRRRLVDAAWCKLSKSRM